MIEKFLCGVLGFMLGLGVAIFVAVFGTTTAPYEGDAITYDRDIAREYFEERSDAEFMWDCVTGAGRVQYHHDREGNITAIECVGGKYNGAIKAPSDPNTRSYVRTQNGQ